MKKGIVLDGMPHLEWAPENLTGHGGTEALTDVLREVFPGDPCKGDFALFGADVNKAVL